MGTRYAVAASLVVAVLCAPAAHPWSAPVHMAVTAVAYQRLPATDRAAVDATLAAHPRFAEWSAAWDPEPGLSLGLYVALRASVWPDELRDPHYAHLQRGEDCLVRDGEHVPDPARQAERDAYDHPDWHFVNFPLRPPDFPIKPPPQVEGDILRALDRARATLRDAAAADADRAAALAWLLHLVADIHQPEHCVAYFGPEFPYGDRGGNWFYIKTATRPDLKLHAYWDNPLHVPGDLAAIREAAADLRGDPALSREQLPELSTHNRPLLWALESRDLAVKLVYLQGRLKPAPVRFGLNPATRQPELKSVDLAHAHELPGGYDVAARDAARRRAALAAFRLADEIGAALAPPEPGQEP
jgi:hypothetical protein